MGPKVLSSANREAQLCEARSALLSTTFARNSVAALSDWGRKDAKEE
jgi:hypothetical protein